MVLVDDWRGSLDFTLAPDSDHVVYATDSLYTAQLDGERVFRQSGDYDSPVYSPDGQDLFFRSQRQLIRAEGDGQRAQVIAAVGSNSDLRPLVPARRTSPSHGF